MVLHRLLSIPVDNLWIPHKVFGHVLHCFSLSETCSFQEWLGFAGNASY